MILKELENVISKDSTVYIQTESNNGLPLLYDSWDECKKHLKKETWNEEIELYSYSGIMIMFKNI